MGRPQHIAIIGGGAAGCFCEIERRICGALDHRDLNEVLPFNPTTENLARWICEQIPQCYKVEVEECPGNEASYER